MCQFSVTSLDWIRLVLKERFSDLLTLEVIKGNLSLMMLPNKKRIFFNYQELAFWKSTPIEYCERWDAVKEGFCAPLKKSLPAPSSSPLKQPLTEFDEQGAIIHYDILGLTYWMLNRIEEIGSDQLDEHGRFPATASHAYKYGYLDRPIVDEWLNILGQVIKKVWPEIKLKEHKFSIKVSHDVDTPSLYAFKPWKNILRMMAGHALKRRDFKAFLSAPYVKFVTNRELLKRDPFNTFDWLMNVSEKNKIKSAFYFICGRTNPQFDGDYEIEHPVMRKLLREIHSRGHEIGLHPSYGTYQKPELIVKEAERLKAVCKEEGIEQPEWGGRMHYLRWKHPVTLSGWDQAGMTYDSTLGYADRAGFRCGTCFEYPGFDPIEQEVLNVRIKPLIAMDCSVTGSAYEGHGFSDEAFERLKHLKKRCISVGGVFSLLWHNSYLKARGAKSLYEGTISS